MAMRKLAIAAAVLVAVAVPLAAAFVALVYINVMPFEQSSGPRPTDAQMIAHWRVKRPVFERLAAMLEEDSSLKRLGKDWSDPDDPASIGIGAERIALYRKLFRDASILRVAHYGAQITFIYFTAGIYIRGSAKSFCYGPLPDYADEIDGDLDAARDQAAREHRRDWYLQRRIEGDWWLQFEGT
jgi:hypothetical protein